MDIESFDAHEYSTSLRIVNRIPGLGHHSSQCFSFISFIKRIFITNVKKKKEIYANKYFQHDIYMNIVIY